MRQTLKLVPLLLVLLAAIPAQAAEFRILIKNNRFDPAELTVPAGERIKLIIVNQDASAEEFESKDLRREKIVAGNSEMKLWVGPLPVGEYGFFGEFHQDTAQGKLIAK